MTAISSMVQGLSEGTVEYDLIVVGSGFAGCMTTLNFLEHANQLRKTAKVALIEAGKEGERCGASRWTPAFFRLDKVNKFDSDFKNEMKVGGGGWLLILSKAHQLFRASGQRSVLLSIAFSDYNSKGLADQAYCEVLETEVPNTVQYLLNHGMKLHHHDEKNVYLGFHTDQNFSSAEGGGYAIILALLEHIRSFPNVDIIWETNAEQLLTHENGTIYGVKVRKNSGLLSKIFGKQVMLACGGFEGNPEMLGRYVGPRAEQLGLIAPGLRYNTGFGLKMGLEVGAATAGSFHGLHCELVDTRSSKPEATIWGHSFGIVVNELVSDGTRNIEKAHTHFTGTQSDFMMKETDREYHCRFRYFEADIRSLFATCEVIAYETWRDQNQKAYFIADAPIMDRFRPGWVYDTTDLDPEKADTIEGLADKLGLDPRELSKTIDEYNASINDEEYNPLILDGKRTNGLSPNKSNWAAPIEVPPFYG
ncbi:hypothetical protein TCE0_004f00162 [Talaromyces pinophilus]|uniref:FAD-dependent oxidoreductase 2 FAD-binding domain-containing protein n=1 Tax=Talaromyces pinophilus TaxID=128442 RepID=A0A0B8N3A2_TALPI|nr:hypothetical protein TCE0_004f00162 [Talaromyces pinophilus]